MITFRRALVVAAFILTCLLLLRNTHSAGSHNKSIQNAGPEPSLMPPTTDSASASTTAELKPASTGAKWNGDNGGRVALAKKPIQQIPLDELKAMPLRKQLQYAFPYDVESKFPGYVWQTWKYQPSSGEFNEAWRAAEASWTEMHPSFVHEVITDDIALHLIKHFYASVPEVVEAYMALPLPVLKADLFRYLILLARGGIYSDIDTTALKSAVEWVPPEVPRSTYGMVIGIEADPDRPDWRDWYSRRIQFCQWTIQSKPGHPILVDVVATIVEETLRRKQAHELDKEHMKSVVEFTGPAAWTDAIFKFFNNAEYFDMATSKGNITWQQFTGIKQAKKVGDVVVLPITSFSPGVGQMGAGEEDDPMAFVKHAFEGSWKPESERHIGENKDDQHQ
ncbi:glycosyltransferase family 32 protein [Baudoinia panamericana UAMH 10762]|uniref:Glycosyltransferase family 32 protein n=1 Tax=Baudoinia panamericana (strain UAMH 10762) TaxID=717646 RepID=M2MRR5_BAUPA|nr:glycosyltransferase family 32 protein [Baudoinia panamericana UAMH 10762]EMC94183.1 glycosyltransferase family 32 protein [Baudoinia panamericana UAMH 10762]